MTGKLLVPFKKLVRELTAHYQFHASVRYRVVRMAGERVELQVVKRGAGWPDVLPISIHAGVPGLSAQLRPGSQVLVQFIEGDPAQPIVTHFAPTSDAAWLPVSLRLDATELVLGDPIASAGRLIARVGDAAGPWVITTGSAKARCE